MLPDCEIREIKSLAKYCWFTVSNKQENFGTLGNFVTGKFHEFWDRAGSYDDINVQEIFPNLAKFASISCTRIFAVLQY